MTRLDILATRCDKIGVVPITETDECNGKDAKGRFAVGNKLGRGNPRLRRLHAIRATIIHAMTHERIMAVIDSLYDQAVAGDVIAARELLDRTIGKPEAHVHVTGDVSPDAILRRIESYMVVRRALMVPLTDTALLTNDDDGNGSARKD